MLRTGDEDLEVIDAQVIFHSEDLLPDLDLSQEARDAIAIDLAAEAMAAAGVDKALWHGEPPIAAAAVGRRPDLFRSMVYYPEPWAKDVDEELAWVAATHGLIGIRITPAWPASGENIERLAAGVYEPWFAAAERLGLPVSLFASGHLEVVPRIARTYPDLRLLVDHIGMPPPPFVPLAPDRLRQLPELLSLAEFENVAVKLTGVPALSFERPPFADLRPVAERIVTELGAGRVMWGSDFRRLRKIASYSEIVDFLGSAEGFDLDAKREMFAPALRRWVGWDEAPAAGS